MCYAILIYYTESLQFCMNVSTQSKNNATIIYIHLIHIGALSLPDITPCVIGKCIYACLHFT